MKAKKEKIAEKSNLSELNPWPSFIQVQRIHRFLKAISYLGFCLIILIADNFCTVGSNKNVG